MNKSFDAPEHCRQRTKEIRTLARMRDLVVKATMLRNAGDYDRLARRPEERLRNKKSVV
jgi:hypothetical protein